MINVNELTVWQYEAPVVSMATDLEFSVWNTEAFEFSPVEDIDESFSAERRRSTIF